MGKEKSSKLPDVTTTAAASKADDDIMPAAGAAGNSPADQAPAPEAPATGDPRGADPSPEFRGKGAGDIAGKTAAGKEPAAPKGKDDPCVKLAREYAKLYPANRIFYITSDMQVFLSDAKPMAQLHQRGLKGGELTTIKI